MSCLGMPDSVLDLPVMGCRKLTYFKAHLFLLLFSPRQCCKCGTFLKLSCLCNGVSLLSWFFKIIFPCGSSNPTKYSVLLLAPLQTEAALCLQWHSLCVVTAAAALLSGLMVLWPLNNSPQWGGEQRGLDECPAVPAQAACRRVAFHRCTPGIETAINRLLQLLFKWI